MSGSPEYALESDARQESSLGDPSATAVNAYGAYEYSTKVEILNLGGPAADDDVTGNYVIID